MRILLLGGSKSGKSMMGQHMARRLSAGAPMYYWATLEPRDGEDRAIVRRHLAERDGWGFETIEQGRQLPEALVRVSPAGTVLKGPPFSLLRRQLPSKGSLRRGWGTRGLTRASGMRQ